VALYFTIGRTRIRHEIYAPPKPEAPPDLAKLQPRFNASLDALQRGDAAAAVRGFSTFDCGHRAVEEYRLLFLGVAQHLSGNAQAARATLADLWSRTPKMVRWGDAGFALGGLYITAGDWNHAADVYRALALRSDLSGPAAVARWQLITADFASGNIAGVLDTARDIAVKNPTTPQAGDAIGILRSLMTIPPTAPIRLQPLQRLERAVSLMRDGDPANALAELNTFPTRGEFAAVRLPIQLNRGLALNQLHRYEESNKILETLISVPYKFAIPAL